MHKVYSIPVHMTTRNKGIIHASQIPKTTIAFTKKISHRAFPSNISFGQHMKMQAKKTQPQHTYS